MKSISNNKRGECNIDDEIISAENPCFVVHDSMGFEHGETQYFHLAKRFLKARNSKRAPLRDRVHVIWLCIKIPTANGRVFETGDENLLAIASEYRVPVIVVFTQYDVLCGAIFRRLPPKERTDEICEGKADKQFQEFCLKQLEPFYEQYPDLCYARTSGLAAGVGANPDRKALDDLVQSTRRLVGEYFPGDTWIVSAMAQRASVKTKIDGAIGVGMKKHWRKLASSSVFAGRKLELCLNTLHFEMTSSWNIYDPNELLRGKEFMERIWKLAQLVTPSAAEAKSWFNVDDLLSGISWAMGLGGPVAAVAIPAVAAVGVSVFFVRFVRRIYKQSPEVLRCFMGYVIDLTLIMEQLFHITVSKSCGPLTEADIDASFTNYRGSGLGNVHREIREFVEQGSFADIVRGNGTEEKMKSLIYKYSVAMNTSDGEF